jgi:L-iditol 2-dehydrogenase
MLALMKTAAGPGQIELRDVPTPTPGPGQVMIEVEAAGICASDLHIRDWDIQLNLRPPFVMGHEFAGRIAEIGAGVEPVASVERLYVGQRVTSETAFSVCGECIPCHAGEYNVCARKELIGYVYDGCFTRYIVVPAHRVHPLPQNVSTREAALTEPLAFVVRAVAELTHIRPGDLVVVGGPGAIGLLALQVARAAGGQVVVLGTPADQTRLAIAAELGARRVVDVTREDAAEVVRQLGHAEGADVYLECAGAPASVRAGIDLVRRRGQYTQLGLPGAPFELDFARIAYKELIVTGAIGQKWSAWRRALALLESGAVRTSPLISHEFPVSRWTEAFALFESRQGLKILLRPD